MCTVYQDFTTNISTIDTTGIFCSKKTYILFCPKFTDYHCQVPVMGSVTAPAPSELLMQLLQQMAFCPPQQVLSVSTLVLLEPTLMQLVPPEQQSASLPVTRPPLMLTGTGPCFPKESYLSHSEQNWPVSPYMSKSRYVA